MQSPFSNSMSLYWHSWCNSWGETQFSQFPRRWYNRRKGWKWNFAALCNFISVHFSTMEKCWKMRIELMSPAKWLYSVISKDKSSSFLRHQDKIEKEKGKSSLSFVSKMTIFNLRRPGNGGGEKRHWWPWPWIKGTLKSAPPLFYITHHTVKWEFLLLPDQPSPDA